MGNCYSIFSNETSRLKVSRPFITDFNRNNKFYNNVEYLYTLYKKKERKRENKQKKKKKQNNYYTQTIRTIQNNHTIKNIIQYI